LHLDKDFNLIAEITGQPTERLAVARSPVRPSLGGRPTGTPRFGLPV
jgi:hypothetical protein